MRRAFLTLAVLAVAAVGWGDWVNNAITVTDESQSIDIDTDGNPMYVWVKNSGATNEIFVCPWRNDQTPAACTATIGRRLEPGEAKSWGANLTKGQYWQAVSLIASAGESSTAVGDSLP
jgi:hypothetical protein